MITLQLPSMTILYAAMREHIGEVAMSLEMARLQTEKVPSETRKSDRRSLPKRYRKWMMVQAVSIADWNGSRHYVGMGKYGFGELEGAGI
jgi:hypothetical protein